MFLQRPGDVAIVSANSPHQVLNLSSCIKMALDFASAPTAAYHLRHLMDYVQPMHGREDYIGLVRVYFHGLTRVVRTLRSATNLYKANRQQEERIRQLEEELFNLRRPSPPKETSVSSHISPHTTRSEADSTEDIPRATKRRPSPTPSPPSSKSSRGHSPDFSQYVGRVPAKKLKLTDASWIVEEEEYPCARCHMTFSSLLEKDRHLTRIHGVPATVVQLNDSTSTPSVEDEAVISSSTDDKSSGAGDVVGPTAIEQPTSSGIVQCGKCATYLCGTQLDLQEHERRCRKTQCDICYEW